MQVKVEAYGAQVGGNLISTCDVFGLFFFIVLLKCIEVQFAGVSGFLYLGITIPGKVVFDCSGPDLWSCGRGVL